MHVNLYILHSDSTEMYVNVRILFRHCVITNINVQCRYRKGSDPAQSVAGGRKEWKMQNAGEIIERPARKSERQRIELERLRRKNEALRAELEALKKNK